MREHERNLSEGNIRRVRRLRSEMSVSEQVLWRRIRDQKLRYKFRRQHPIGDYVLDFYCPRLKLCVEVDGEQHAFRREADAKRDEFLLSKGIKTVRIPSMQLFGDDDMNSDGWAFMLRCICKDRAIELGLPDLREDY